MEDSFWDFACLKCLPSALTLCWVRIGTQVKQEMVFLQKRASVVPSGLPCSCWEVRCQTDSWSFDHNLAFPLGRHGWSGFGRKNSREKPECQAPGVSLTLDLRPACQLDEARSSSLLHRFDWEPAFLICSRWCCCCCLGTMLWELQVHGQTERKMKGLGWGWY